MLPPLVTEPVMTARRLGLGEIAYLDPILAYTVLKAGMAPGGYVDVGGWQTLSIKGIFESGAADQTVPAQIIGTIEADLWVREVIYTVRRPNYAPGNIITPISNVFNSLSPDVDYTLFINSFCRYLIATEPTPLQNIRASFSQFPVGLILRYASNIKADFTLNRALAQGEVPYECIITMHATRLPLGLYGQSAQARDKVVEELVAQNILPRAA